VRTWTFLLAGLLVWTVHFFGIYTIASIWLTSTTSRALTLVLTLLCLGANGWLLRRALPALRASRSDEVDHWVALVATLGIALSLLAVLWQGLPAILS
jgi:hypothetical protein